MRTTMLFLVVVALLGMTLAGCSSLPDDVKNSAKKVPDDVKAALETVSRQKGSFDKIQNTEDYTSFLKAYSEREKWPQAFVDAQAKVDHASGLNTELQALVEKNEPNDTEKCRLLLDRIGIALREARDLSGNPIQRADFLKKVRKEAPEIVARAKTERQKTLEILGAISTVIEKVKLEFPQKVSDLTTRVAPLSAVDSSSGAALETAVGELNSETPDYAKLGDSCSLITSNLKKIGEQDQQLRAKAGELYRSYSKILVDMRADYYIQVGRASWDDYSDWDTTREMMYPLKKVDAATYEYFAGLPEGTIATISSGWGGSSVSVKCNKTHWDALRIDVKDSWPGGHDDAEFWINDFDCKCFHKYIVLENGKKTETGWVEVDEEDFLDNVDNLGMEIVSKPYGYYEEEKLEEAAPPGMSKVGNPKYGKWETDSATGEKRWSWLETYAMYHLFFGGSSHHYYHYGEWDTWNRNYRGQDSYYGRDTKNPTYGTYSRGTQSKYAGTTFSRSGGFKSQSASVRGAGATRRGGGPGGSGK